MRKDRFIPIRFLSLTIQTILTILIFTDLDKHVEAGSWQERQIPQTLQFQLRVQLIVSLSLSLFFNLIEYFGMFSGISTFAYSQVVISSLCHCAGSVLVILFHLEQWSSQYFWFVFGFCSLLPFLTECLVWLRVLVFHRNVYLLGQ